MHEFIAKVAKHIDHVKKVGEHCTTEETTKQALILPLLEILGFNPYDPTKVRAEHASDFPGVKVGERVDYALFCNNVPVMFIEAKGYAANLNNHCPQLSRYFNATPEVTVGAITNGREWRFFTDLVNKNIMDSEPFLTIKFDGSPQDTSHQLARFHHDKFQPEALRALAEENIYLNAFKASITTVLRECDADFVKYIAGRANIQRTFTAKFIEGVQPIMKQALAKAISDMVTSSLSSPTPEEPPQIAPVALIDPAAPTIDPTNAKIITTANERRVLEICQELLPDEDLHGKDTESYFTVLYQGKNNRWMVRYWGDKKRPSVAFCMPLTDAHRIEIKRSKLEIGAGDTIMLDRPEHLLRLTGLLDDALAFSKNDDNFKRGASASAAN
ncbi:MAG: hypothetical protein FD135_1411 [Comamonadaceae bacterium]|nr:MAG: hypothetical protein FD135_1411 [Comamonadaceae bacterium]